MRPAILRHIAPLALALAVFSPAAANPEEKPLSEAELARLKADANYDNAAQYRLGMLYLRGDQGVARDRARAESLLKNAALQGNAEAAYELGFLISTTPGADGDQAMKWLRIAANKDMPKAQYALGDLYVHFGEPGLAVEWYGKAAAQGHVAAKRQLGTLLLLGQGVRKDEQRGLALVREAAEKGDTDAQYKLCGAYQTGLGVAKDEKTALDWLKKAAAGGHPQAQFLLGDNLLYGGPTLAQNKAEAEKWLKLAAAQGHQEAQSALNELKTAPACTWDDLATLTTKAESGDAQACRILSIKYEKGTPDLPVNEKLAIHWLKKAAEGGDLVAQYNLGAAFFNGAGVPKDEKAAMEWLRKAAVGGNAGAQETLGRLILIDTKNKAEAMKWLSLAAAQGHPKATKLLESLREEKLRELEELRALTIKAEHGNTEAQRMLGNRYEKDGDDEHATIWLTKASEKNDADAQLSLALLLIKKGALENEAIAIRWLTKAANQGNKLAMAALGGLYADSTTGNKNDIEAEKWLKRSGEAVGCAVHCLLGQIYTRDQGVKPDDVEAYARFSLAAEKAKPREASFAQYSAKRRDELAAKLGPRLDEAKARLKALKAELAAPKEPTATP